MAARAYWKGFLRLSLVSIAVEIYNAVESKSEISFRQIHKPSGKRVNYTKTVQGVGEIQNADIVKGYEVDADTYVVLDPDEIDAVKLESKKTIDLVKFVDSSEIDPRFFERPYYIAPADQHAAEGYVVIRDALRKTEKTGLAQLTIGGREWLVAISALEDGLLMEMLRYADELKEAPQFFAEVPDIKPDKEMIDLAIELIGRKSGTFKPKEFENHYAAALRELINKKLKGQKIVAPHEEPPPGSAKVIDLMSALRKSIGEGGSAKGRGGGGESSPKAKTSARSTPARRAASTTTKRTTKKRA
ncbi:Ku protein [Hyphomicrobium sulfonivorans]|uniref:non-homologous end joining protein Ku n=1 Tax=Hyphomicrobium sulfonivorans TaxID=121290 RepID=UPI00156E4B69|nr:Ku protein [Hyphomicrobium sulfonivorans]MBI1648867.1 Ku protein [Hyphomicrobium sulfonivorans]NSL70598.1 Ku protein [Hyphomicrobium sulfonivorans]